MPTTKFTALDQLCIDTIRTLAIDAVEKANSGHPGLPLGAAPMAYVLWQRHLRFDPRDPNWPDRDRFVLSAGHGSALLYALPPTTLFQYSLLPAGNHAENVPFAMLVAWAFLRVHGGFTRP